MAIIKFVANYKVNNILNYATIQEVAEFCQSQTILGLDIETTCRYPKGTYTSSIYKGGLDPYLSKTIMIQLGTEELIYVIDSRCFTAEELSPIWKNVKTTTYVTHNGKFEAKHLQHNYGIIFHRICDVMLQEMVLTNGLGWSKENKEGLRYSLEAMAGRYLGIKPAVNRDLFTPEEDEEQEYIDKSIRMGFLTIGDKPFTEEQILYGADDIVYPLKIKELQKKGFQGYNPKEVLDIENEFCLVLADIELKGMTFDKEQWLKNYQENLIVYNRRLEKLNNWVIANHKKFCTSPDMFQPEYKCAIEWSSSKQVIKLFKHIGFCPQEKSKATKFMEYTVGAKALLKLLPSDYKELYEKDIETDIVEEKDLILNYLLLSTAEQSITTFGDEYLKYIHPVTGRLHSTYKQILNTGRISSNSPNLQNLPSEQEYRKAFKAPEGCSLINVDFSSQETRLLAELSEDAAMISFFNDGHPVHGSDFHSYTATKMFSLMRNEPDLIVSKKTHPQERDAAKNISFKIPYGGSAYTLKDDFGVEEEVAQEFIDNYMKAFPSLDKYFDDGRKAAVKNGYIDILPDRRYWEPNWKKMNSINQQIWKWYPENYKYLSKEEREKAKAKVKEEHPEVSGMWKEYFMMKGELERCSQNYRIQGLAGTQTKKAGILFRRYQIEHNLREKVWLTNLVHDETLAESIIEFTEEAVKIVTEAMIQGGNDYCKKVKMGAAGGECSYWGH